MYVDLRDPKTRGDSLGFFYEAKGVKTGAGCGILKGYRLTARVGSTKIRSFVRAEGFPSGQRDQTVNLTAPPSEVRILPPPPLRALVRVDWLMKMYIYIYMLATSICYLSCSWWNVRQSICIGLGRAIF